MDIRGQFFFYWNTEGIKKKSLEFFDHLIIIINKNNAPQHKTPFITKIFDAIVTTSWTEQWVKWLIVSKNIKHELLPDTGTWTIESVGIKVCSDSTSMSFLSAYFPGTDSDQSQQPIDRVSKWP